MAISVFKTVLQGALGGSVFGDTVIAAICLVAAATQSTASPADLCLSAAQQAASTSDVPLSVLVAITQLETGRSRNGQTEPWPWTINIEGQGHWFDSQDAALTFARQALTADRTSFDTGCFQINYRWHSGEFASLDAMFDPFENARYAARFLTELYAESGDWSIAAGAYHSRTESHATGYREKFDRLRVAAADFEPGGEIILAQSGDGLPTAGISPLENRENNFPLLRPTSGGLTLGSLVPMMSGG